MSKDNGVWLALGSVAALAAVARVMRGSKSYWRAEGSVTIPTEYTKSFGFQMQESEYSDPSDLTTKFQDAEERALEQLSHSEEHVYDWERVGADSPATDWESEITLLQRLPPSIRDLKRGAKNTDHWTVHAFKKEEERHSYDDVFWLEGEEDDDWTASNTADNRMRHQENLTYQEEGFVEDGIDSLELTDSDGRQYAHHYKRGEI